MHRCPRFQSLIVLCVVGGALACGDVTTPLTERGGIASKTLQQDGRQVGTAENPYPRGRSEWMFFEIAQRVPAFGGVHRRGDVTVISVTDTIERESVHEALRSWISDYARVRGLSDEDLEWRVVAFGYADLTEWRQSIATSIASGEDVSVSFVGVSERENRVVVGLRAQAAEASVRASLASRGIPTEALTFKLAGMAASDAGLSFPEPSGSPGTPTTDTLLHETFDPTPGGVGAQYEADNELIPCSFGFNARKEDYSGDLGFLTASHCSETVGGVDGSVTFRQNGDSNPVGVEAIDPWFSCGWNCKLADAAWYEFESGRDADFALIARTQDSLGNLPDSRKLGSPSRFQVNGAVSNPVEGDSVFKIGNATGWTTGEVQDTCVNFSRFGFTLECQDLADYGRATGDSGGPVLLPSGASYVVCIIGLHNGVQDATGFGIFSAVANIEGDLEFDLYVGPGVH